MTEAPRTSATLEDVIAEATRLVDLWAAAGVRARLLGGIAIAFHAHSGVPEPFCRTYGDIDLVVERSDAQRYRHLMLASGYEENVRFNSLHGYHRLMHHDPVRGRPIDTFVGEFRMCHELDLAGALPPVGATLRPADLMLTKLQVVEVNTKDLSDVLTLLVDHDIADGDDAISAKRIAAVTGTDWGWHTTLSDNLVKLRDHLGTIKGLDGTTRDLLDRRIAAIQKLLEIEPKSMGWKVRARLGRRVPWYDLPDESRD